MKKLFFAVILFVTTFSFSQEYLPMLEDGNSWGAAISDLYFPTIYFQFDIGEEIIADNKVYKRIILNGEETECLFREENGVVYYLNSTNIEQVLFDFTLEIGDVFELNNILCFVNGNGNLTVVSISYEYIAGENRKVLEMEGFSNEYWIEGLGSTNGGLYSGVQNIEGGSSLLCFYHNGETYYFNNSTNCNIVLSNNDNFINNITVYPNPITERSILQLPLEAEIDHLKIYNISGKLIKEETISSDNYILNNMNFASGLYFYQVSSKGKHIKTEKFIVK